MLALRCVQGAVTVTLSHHHLQMIHELSTKNDVAIFSIDYINEYYQLVYHALNLTILSLFPITVHGKPKPQLTV